MSPISVDELHRRNGKVRLPRPGTNPDRVLDFLRDHIDEAWRGSELSANLDIEIHTLGSVLRRLRARGLIDVKDEHWYALEDDEIAKLQGGILTTRLANEKLGPEDLDDWPSIPQPPDDVE
jgi:hypothetical protein